MTKIEKDKMNYISNIMGMSYKYIMIGENTISIPTKETKYHFREVMNIMLGECEDFNMIGTYYYDRVRSNWVYKIMTVGGGPLSEFIEVQDLGSFSQIGAHEIENDLVIFKRIEPLRELEINDG